MAGSGIQVVIQTGYLCRRKFMNAPMKRFIAATTLALAVVVPVSSVQADSATELTWLASSDEAFAQRRRATPLEFAAVGRSGIDSAPATADEGERRLIRAARSGDAGEVKRQLDSGARANARSFWGERPLMAAVEGGHGEVVRVLLERGADPDARGEGGFTPLGAAALRGHARIVRLLSAAGASTEERSSNGNTPLIEAVLLDRREVVRELLPYRPDTARYSREGLSAVALAARAGHDDILDMLLASGADPNGLDRGGRPPLYWALFGRRRAAVVALLKHGADAGAMAVDIFDEPLAAHEQAPPPAASGRPAQVGNMP